MYRSVSKIILRRCFRYTPLTHFLFKLPAKLFEPNVATSDIGKMEKSECGHYPAEQVPQDVFGELVNFFWVTSIRLQ